MMVSFSDQHRAEYGVEPICSQLPIAPATYYEHKAREADPERLPPRGRRDVEISQEIQRVWDENFQVYGARKIWRQLGRERVAVARCSAERLMRSLGLQGVVRGGKRRTMISRDQTAYPADLVKRQFAAIRPNQLWAADFTYVATGRGSSTRLSSSMCSLVASSAGASPARCIRTWSWMRSSRRCGLAPVMWLIAYSNFSQKFSQNS
jgi:putative transposase